MSRLLSDLLSGDEPSFTNSLRRLESDSGNPSIDIRLVADIAAKVKSKMRELGLDPSDTNARELYYALQALIKKHDEFLTNSLGVKDPTDHDNLLPKIVEKVKDLDIPKTCWALKPTSAKKLLKQSPPKKVMKQLNYRSIDSLLKREDMDEVFVAIRLLESPTWLRRFISSYRKLSSNDFENRKVNVYIFDDHRWGDEARTFTSVHNGNLLHLKDMGVIAVLPFTFKKMAGLSITLLPLILHYLNEIRVHSSYLKLQQVKADFSEYLVESLAHDVIGTVEISGQAFDWRTIARHYVKEKTGVPGSFEPNLQFEDIVTKKADEVLYKLEPALKFWEGLDYVGVMGEGKPVPLGLIDNALSYFNHLDYGRQSVSNFQRSLWDELLSRYVGRQPIEEKLLKQLGNDADGFDFDFVDAKGLA